MSSGECLWISPETVGCASVDGGVAVEDVVDRAANLRTANRAQRPNLRIGDWRPVSGRFVDLAQRRRDDVRVHRRSWRAEVLTDADDLERIGLDGTVSCFAVAHFGPGRIDCCMCHALSDSVHCSHRCNQTLLHLHDNLLS